MTINKTNETLIKFKKPTNFAVMIAAEQAWKTIAVNDKLLRAGTITREEWFNRRDALVAELKTRANV